MVAETSMCSLPTMKFSAAAAPGLPGVACRLGDWRRRCRFLCERAFVFFVVHVERANDEELSGRTCDFVQDFSRCSGRRFESDIDHVALDQFRRRCAARLRGCRNSSPATGDGVGVTDAPCSSGKGRRRNAVTLSTLASSKMLMSIWICESSCPSNAATAVPGIVRANSSKPS